MKIEYFYTLASLEHLSVSINKTVLHILLAPESDVMPYEAGQYIEIQYPDGSFQPFSIANAPKPDGQLELFIRMPESDLLTQQFLSHLKKTKRLRILGPFGRCVASLFLHQPTRLLSGGVGFSQSKAIIEQLILDRHAKSLHLYWALSNPTAVFLGHLLREWSTQLPQFQYTFIFPPSTVIEQITHDHFLTDDRILVSGPREMTFSAEALYNHGLRKGHLFSDWFDIESSH